MERESSSVVSISSPSPPRLVRPSRSFRLRSPSLNTLRLRRVFDLFDRDSDGQITVVELSQALDRLGLGADPSDLATTVSSFIRPGCQGLEFEDFEALHREIGDSLFGFGSSSSIGEEVEEDEDEADVEGDMEEAFRVFDVDGDGFISANELYTVLGKMGLGEGLSIARVHDMIYSVDKNRDGRVDFGEFKDMMMGITLSGA